MDNIATVTFLAKDDEILHEVEMEVDYNPLMALDQIRTYLSVCQIPADLDRIQIEFKVEQD